MSGLKITEPRIDITMETKFNWPLFVVTLKQVDPRRMDENIDRFGLRALEEQ